MYISNLCQMSTTSTISNVNNVKLSTMSNCQQCQIVNNVKLSNKKLSKRKIVKLSNCQNVKTSECQNIKLSTMTKCQNVNQIVKLSQNQMSCVIRLCRLT